MACFIGLTRAIQFEENGGRAKEDDSVPQEFCAERENLLLSETFLQSGNILSYVRDTKKYHLYKRNVTLRVMWNMLIFY